MSTHFSHQRRNDLHSITFVIQKKKKKNFGSNDAG